jgi:RNA polymerase sigma factor (TIGR02999 family)
MPQATSEITLLLRRWSAGDAQALDQLIPLVYDRMRQLAHQRLRVEPGNSINTTALVHEAYLKLVDAPQPGVHDRAHFLALASRVMRHLMVDHARARNAAKRGGGMPAVQLDEMIWVADDALGTVTELDDALKRLEALDARQCRILEQRYFGGLTLEETAQALDVSLATVKRELRSARAWLATQLRSDRA